MLEELCNLCGISGYEKEVIEYIISKLDENSIAYEMDKLGNIIVRQGENPDKIALFAHLDEVGAIVRGITKDGHIKFAPVGGITDEILLSSLVLVGDNKVNGVIGNIPKHLKEKKDDNPTKIEDLFIDIGAYSKENAQEFIKIGDPIYFNSKYVEFGDDQIKAKALDDRVGVAVILKMLLSKKYSFTACFTTREEIGLVGAKIVTNHLKAKRALVLEVTTCCDMPKNTQPSTVLGQGVALSVLDSASVSNQAWNNDIVKIAKKNKIKMQYKLTTKGGNDAGAISYYNGGVKTVVLSLPGRYIHSPVSVISKSDYEAMEKLVEKILEEPEYA
jgi:endoglucanase